MKVLLTGGIGSGKSTAVSRVLDLLGEPHPAGFRTRPVYREGVRAGFRLEDWTGSGQVFARAGGSGPSGLVRFDPDLNVFRTVGIPALRLGGDADLLVIDELGIMEQPAEEFVTEAAAACSRCRRVLAVVQRRALEFWSLRLAAAGFDHRLTLDRANRDDLPRRIAAWLRPAAAPGPGSF